MWPSSARIRGPSGVRSAVLWLSAAPALPARPGYGSVSAENSAPRGATSSARPPPRRRSHLVRSVRQGKAPRRGQRRLHAAARPCPARGTCPRKPRPGPLGTFSHVAGRRCGQRAARFLRGLLCSGLSGRCCHDVLSCAVPVIPGPRPSCALPKPCQWAPERLQFLHTAPLIMYEYCMI